MERFYSLPEAAEALRLSEHTLRKWVQTGRIGYSKVGDRTLFAESDLDCVIRRRDPRGLNELVASLIEDLEATNNAEMSGV